MKPTLSAQMQIALPTLLETRMLVQANSGGGKSWGLRRLLEQTANSVQQLVIDPEGEFATLREKFDYLIAAPHDGDALATPQTAALLARRLLESGVSAILDIYDLKAHERILFVKRFLDALVNAPKSLWHPLLIVLDEAHIFAPQNGSAESASAVIDIATRGRKRGQCLVAATQRLSKLHKDVAAELGNKMIGRTGLDVDVKRAADELGLTSRDATEALRSLSPGQFYVFGPALSQKVERITVGDVQTSHPKAGNRMMTAPPAPSPKLRAQLAKLADLQKESEQEARTIEELKADNAKLRREATLANKRAEQTGIPEAEVQRLIREAVLRASRDESHAAAVYASTRVALERIASAVDKELKRIPDGQRVAGVDRIEGPISVAASKAAPRPAPVAGDAGITGPQQKILDALAQLSSYGVMVAAKEMVAAHAGVSPTSGGYFNNLGKLRSLGFIDYPSPGSVALTHAGKLSAASPTRAPTLDELHDSWLAILPTPQAAILREAIAVYPEGIDKNRLADVVGVSRTSGGYFNNLGRLRTLGAIDYPQRGIVRASDILFPQRS